MYNLGLMALKSLIEQSSGLDYFKAKLEPSLFRGDEVAVFDYVDSHYRKYSQLPTLETVSEISPEITTIPAGEPPSFYLDRLQNRYVYTRSKDLIEKTAERLKENKNDAEGVIAEIQNALGDMLRQKYRRQIVNFTEEGARLLLNTYKGASQNEIELAHFDWPYLDHQTGGLYGGDVVSIVGRPASGKSWFAFRSGLVNWNKNKMNVMVVSMEMSTIQVAQRLASIYAAVPATQLKTASFSSHTFQKFISSLKTLTTEEASLYIVDGNLSAHVEEVYALASMLKCRLVVIDGAYLMKHPNKRLDRYTRVAENVELMKARGTDTDIRTVASWQFNRGAAKKDKRKGEKTGLEDIGSSDAIGQISSIVLGLEQEESVETLYHRHITLLKGREGQVGGFDVHWDFLTMNFDQVSAEDDDKPLEFI